MIFANPTFNTPKIRQFIYDLISDYDYTHYKDLSYADKCEFTSLLIEAAGRSGEKECLLESNHLDQVMYQLKKSLNDPRDDGQNLSFIMKEVVTDYYDETMEALFKYALSDYNQDKEDWLDYIGNHGDPDDCYMEELR